MTDTVLALLTDIQSVASFPAPLARRLENMIEREADMEQMITQVSPVVVMRAFKPGDVVFVEMQRRITMEEAERISTTFKHYGEQTLGVKICVLDVDMKVVGRSEEDLARKDTTVFDVKIDQLSVLTNPNNTKTCNFSCSFFHTASAIPLIADPLSVCIKLDMRAEGGKWLEAAFAAKKQARVTITLRDAHEIDNT